MIRHWQWSSRPSETLRPIGRTTCIRIKTRTRHEDRKADLEGPRSEKHKNDQCNEGISVPQLLLYLNSNGPHVLEHLDKITAETTAR